MKVTPYLNFEGRCEEAIEFYKTAVGAKIGMVLRFKDAPVCPEPVKPETANKIMHCSFQIGDTVVLASDGRCRGTPAFNGISLSLNAEDDDGAERVFKALSPGGTVTMPLTSTFFASSFGMLIDKFGITWMIVAEKGAGK